MRVGWRMKRRRRRGGSARSVLKIYF